MWGLPRPPHDPELVYKKCISRSRIRSHLLQALPEVNAAVEKYLASAEAGSTHLLLPAEFESSIVSGKDLEKNYKERMASVKAAGRGIYHEIRDVSDRVCPMCGHRPVSTLDHALPKSKFPLLAVAPNNLVPCCSDCNHSKREKFSPTASSTYLHPYFDNVDDEIWLVASVVESLPPAVIYEVQPPASWDAVLGDRVENQFRSLGIAELYTSQAGSEITALRVSLDRAYRRDGPEGVRETLRDCRDGRRLLRLNSWQGALYDALLKSEWFCEGGFVGC